MRSASTLVVTHHLMVHASHLVIYGREDVSGLPSTKQQGRAACLMYVPATLATKILVGLPAGDAFVCAFHTAEAAVAWALNTQQVLPVT